MRIPDLIEVRSVPTIVDPSDVRELRSHLRGPAPPTKALETLCQLTEHYYVLDAHNRIALETALQSLAGQRGAGFFISGVYGSGKSHLLALLSLVLEFPDARSSFLRTHEEFADEVIRLSSLKRLVVFMSLEEYSPGRHSLEDVFWKETSTEFRRHGIAIRKGNLDASRSEQFAEFERAISDNGYEGAVWLIDELSMFLGGRKHSDLQGDASFLQFLGQRMVRGPHWLIAALQKNVEDIGELDPYSLSQIRDRFQTRLMLSLAHVRTLIRGRLVKQTVPEQFLGEMARIVDSLCVRLPRLDFGIDDLHSTYPFHPATIDLLEAAASRFFSRTRSALKFAQDILKPGRCNMDCSCLITPDEIFDYFQPDIVAHPELRAFHETIYRWYESRVEDLAPHHPSLALRLAKILIICKIAGVNPTSAQCANWSLADCGLEGDETYAYVDSILNNFVTRGAFVAMERRPDEFGNIITLDLGARTNELARRRIANISFTFEPNDSRIAASAFETCTEGDWPFASQGNHAVVWWRNSERRILVERKDLRSLDALEIHGRLDALGSVSEEDAVVYVGYLFRIAAQREQWLRVLLQFKDGGCERWAHSLIALLPRELSADEVKRLSEFAASELLMQDPELRDNRRGRAILEWISAEQPSRSQDIRSTIVRAFRDGEVLLAGDASVRVSELIADPDSLESLLIALSERIFPSIFPKFSSIAPRIRLPGSNACDALALEILRSKESRSLPASSERLARSLLIPLGVAAEHGSQICVAPLPDPIRSAVLKEVPPCGFSAPLREIDSKLRKSEWGLPDGITRIAIASLMREGEIVCEDPSGAPLSHSGLTAPLRDHIAFIRRGQLLPMNVWADVRTVLSVLCPHIVLEEHSLAAQEETRDRLLELREQATTDSGLTQSRLVQLRNIMPTSVERSFELLREWSAILSSIDDFPLANQALSSLIEQIRQQFGDLFLEPLQAHANEFRKLYSVLEENHRSAIDLHAYLIDVELVLAHGKLASQHALAMGHLVASGELSERLCAFCQAGSEFKQSYMEAYLRWHGTIHSEERSRQVSELMNHPSIRLIEQIHRLTWIPMPRMQALIQSIRANSSNVCLQPALDQWLERRPVCPRCHLRLGEEFAAVSMLELVDEANAAIEDFVRAFGDSAFRDRMTEFANHSDLPEARDIASLLKINEDMTSDKILPLLNDRTIDRLRFIMAPARRVRRDLATLRIQLAGRMMKKSEAIVSFGRWLDGEDILRNEDDVEFSS